jgi:hypothetical protein
MARESLPIFGPDLQVIAQKDHLAIQEKGPKTGIRVDDLH